MSRSQLWKRVGALLFVIIAILVVRNQVKVYLKGQVYAREAALPHLTFAEFRPVALGNCHMERFGETNDGGYLLCGNLLGSVKAGDSHGISAYDQWGCDVSTRLSVPTHQYDCFNTTVPQCPAGRTIFHAECVAGMPRTEDGRSFDTIANQLAKNGDGANHIVLKVDVEGAEWESFEALPAHFHENNFSCKEAIAPFPSWAYEVLFVNKQLDEVDLTQAAPIPHPLDARNRPQWEDCATQNGTKPPKG